MPWDRETLSQLIADAAADIENAMPGADALLRYGNLKVLATMVAGFANLHYGYEDYIAKQCVPFTATGEFLEGWAALKNVFRKPAQAWAGTTDIAGAGVGITIPEGTPFVRGDGKTYTSTADATTDGGGAASVPVIADSASLFPPADAADWNCDNGNILTLGVAIAGIPSNSTVSSTTQKGVNTEGDEALRGRMLFAFQNPPAGGSATDYVRWATEAVGVTRAWCMPTGLGAGTVVVYFMMDEAEAIHGGFPQGTDGVATAEPRGAPKATGDQLIVANYIYPLQPVTALVYAYAPTNNPIAFTISGTALWSIGTKNAVKAALSDVFFRKGSVGGTYAPDATVPGEIDLDEFEIAIASVAGTAGFVIVTPNANVTSASGELPTLGVVTFNP